MVGRATSETAAPAPAGTVAIRRSRGFWRRLVRPRLGMAGLAVILGVVFCALAAPMLTPYDPSTNRLLEALNPPSPTHPLGTDDLGRDVLTRVLWGARVSL